MRDRLIELMQKWGTENTDSFPFESVADFLLSEGVIVPPCKVGDMVYKICPKCNDRHSGSCRNCAWSGCHMTGCDVGVGVYSDGSHGNYNLHIVPRKVSEHSIITVFKWWNIMYFATVEEATAAKEEYDAIRKIQDRKERYEAYKVWEAKRGTRYAFLERSNENAE